MVDLNRNAINVNNEMLAFIGRSGLYRDWAEVIDVCLTGNKSSITN